MLKRFTWKENEIHSIQLKNDLFVVVQVLKAPFIAVFNLKSSDPEFDNDQIDLSLFEPFGVCMVLKEFFKKCSVGKIKNFKSNLDISIPELFISKDRGQWGNSSQFTDDQLIHNLVRIDPLIGDQGIMGNEIVEYNIDKKEYNSSSYEITGYNTGYEFVRRLILSIENNRWIDPLKELRLLGEDNYPLKTVEEMWKAGVPKY
ncbi:hypothetical protein [Flavobacterium ginsenosidimutans]|uniref:hypothetical protein n=1 Tax=Flavobacterium ginsenosidimutans TaxID=687844 RepID=UPI000DADDB0C|nr:hypothetical protein [Flavobacterium ginsenosidimutans]KAF2329610.1 hypothetical protein DM444_15300 [Flavobacterium ginsenosidimutans]